MPMLFTPADHLQLCLTQIGSKTRKCWISGCDYAFQQPKNTISSTGTDANAVRVWCIMVLNGSNECPGYIFIVCTVDVKNCDVCSVANT